MLFQLLLKIWIQNEFIFLFHSIEHFKMPIEVHRPVWWHYTLTLPSLDSGSAWRKCKPHQTRTRTTAPAHRAPEALSCSATPNNTSKGIGKEDHWKPLKLQKPTSGWKLVALFRNETEDLQNEEKLSVMVHGTYQAPGFQTSGSATHRINHSPGDKY